MRNFLAAIVVLLALSASGQDSVPAFRKYYKNTIKLNPTPYLLFGGRNFTVGYERVVKASQSFSIHLGPAEMPGKFPKLDSAILSRTGNKWGFLAAADYRFYILKRNTHAAPDGLYWGPYMASYYYNNSLSLTLDNQVVQGKLDLGANLLMLNFGVQLGYQFTIGKRLSVDLVLAGPSLSGYYANLKAKSDGLKIDGEQVQEIKEALLEQFPFLSNYVLEADLSKKDWAFGGGFRYLVAVGYRF